MRRSTLFRTVEDIQVVSCRGPWDTKSGGKLNVTLAMPFSTVQEQYFNYDEQALQEVPEDIRGLRIYTVRCLPKGRIGGTEWHKVREEIVFGLEGSVLWMCEDLFGGKKEWVLTPSMGVWMPPYILHTYNILEEGSGLLVVANTLFDPDDKRTHDTYPIELFHSYGIVP